MFEAEEQGSSKHLMKFLSSAKENYETAIEDLVYNPGVSPLELVTPTTVARVGQFFSTVSRQVRKKIKSPRLIKILEFPVLFLGAKPEKTPALYSLMNYADTMLGTWYPMGGMHEIVRALVRVAERNGVQFHYEQDVASIDANHGKVSGVTLRDGTKWKAETIIAAADYHHVEQHLLPAAFRRYDATYWDNRVMSPSCLLYTSDAADE